MNGMRPPPPTPPPLPLLQQFKWLEAICDTDDKSNCQQVNACVINLCLFSGENIYCTGRRADKSKRVSNKWFHCLTLRLPQFNFECQTEGSWQKVQATAQREIRFVKVKPPSCGRLLWGAGTNCFDSSTVK